MFLTVMLAVFLTPSLSSWVAAQKAKNCTVDGQVIKAGYSKAFFRNDTHCEGYYCYADNGHAHYQFILSAVCPSGCLNTSSTLTCTCLRNCSVTNTGSGNGTGSGSGQPSAGRSDPCAQKPCTNGGTCSAGNGDDFVCTCTDDYEGTLCELRVDWCLKRGCQNGATCVPQSSVEAKASCECAAGYTGDLCEKHVCEPNPCRNGGQCSVNSTQSSGYSCACTNGYTGHTCLLCSDTGCSCQDKKTAGKCDSDRDAMLTQCPHTCGFCKPPTCSDGFTLHEVSCYKAQNTRQMYVTASSTCRGVDSHVAVPRSKDENKYLRDLLSGPMWVGAMYVPKRGAWVKGTDTVAFAKGDFQNWLRTGKPKGKPTATTCIKMKKKGKWITVSCKRKNVFVCRYDL